MYFVVSTWEALPGKEAQFEQNGETMRGILRSRPEIEFAESFHTEENTYMVIIGYRSKADYEDFIKPGGFFEQSAKEQELEESGRWIHSWRGEQMELAKV